MNKILIDTWNETLNIMEVRRIFKMADIIIISKKVVEGELISLINKNL